MLKNLLVVFIVSHTRLADPRNPRKEWSKFFVAYNQKENHVKLMRVYSNHSIIITQQLQHHSTIYGIIVITQQFIASFLE